MNTDERRFAEFVWKNIIFICILYANVNITLVDSENTFATTISMR